MCLVEDEKEHEHHMWKDHHRGRERRSTIRSIWRRYKYAKGCGGVLVEGASVVGGALIMRFNRRKSIVIWLVWIWRIWIKKERLRSQGTGMSTNILSLMMDGRTVEEDLPYTGSGLGTLWRLLVEQVHKRIKVIETGNEKLRMEDMACELERKVCE